MTPETYDIFVSKKISHGNDTKVNKFVDNTVDDDSDYSYVDLRSYISNDNKDDKDVAIPKGSLVLTCGQQGSGKSTFCNRMKLMGSIIVPYTEKKKTLRAVSQLPNNNVTYIVDGTFPSNDLRQEFIDATNRHVVIVYFKTPNEICKHNRLYRELFLGQDHIPDIAINIFKKKFEKPKSSATVDVIVVPFALTGTEPDEYFLFYY